MIYFIAYTYTDPESREKMYDNEVTDLSEYPGSSDIKEFEKNKNKEISRKYKGKTKKTDTGEEVLVELVEPDVKVISLQKL